MSDVKFCVRCYHYARIGNRHLCLRDKGLTSVSVVTGELCNVGQDYVCSQERRDKDKCGPAARFYEPKTEETPNE